LSRPSLDEDLPKVFRAAECTEVLQPGFGVVGCGVESGVAANLRDARSVRRNNGTSECHRLERRKPESLGQGRKRETQTALQERGEFIVVKAPEPHDILGT
jgi:hypothetical protein